MSIRQYSYVLNMPIELRHLRYFIAVAEEGHITRAAERIGMQQPPLSQQIKALETQVGAKLFLRKPRGVVLTEAGRTFLADAREVFSGLDRAIETTRRAARGEQGRICVGVTPTAPFNPLVPQVIRVFRDSFPLVALTVEEGFSNDLLRLQHDRVDVAFIRNRVANTEGLTVTPLADEPMVVALPSRHELARADVGEAMLMKCLARESFILYGPPGSGIYDATIAACHQAGFGPRVSQLAPRITSTLGLVAAGLGISLVPESMCCVRLDGVSYRRLKGAVQPRAVLNLVSRRGDPSGVVGHFLHTVNEQRGKQMSSC